MNETEKAAAGLLYDANHDPDLIARRRACSLRLFEFNHTSPAEADRRRAILRTILGSIGRDFVIEAPFHCDYGTNMSIGDNFYANVNLVVLDCARVTIGNSVFVGPNVGLYTAGHPLDSERRNRGLEYACPIDIGGDVWIGAGVSVLPGVTIGRGSVIGAGAVVTRDVPPMTLAAGNPARVLRPITEDDRQRHR